MKKMQKRAAGFILAICMILSCIPVPAAAAASDNLALNKPASASDVESGTSFTADKAVDGNSGTRWATNRDTNAVKTARWLQIDFESTVTFDTVDISWEQANILSYEIQVSDDAGEDSWTTVYSRESEPTMTDESITLSAPASGRYMRIYVSDFGGDWASVSIYEVGVYYLAGGGDPSDSDGNYTIYPIPQKVTDEDGTVELTDTVNVVVEDGIDAVTHDRVDEVLTENGLTPQYSGDPSDDYTNLYVGINGSGGAADSLEDIPREVFDEGENKYDMHVVKVFEEGDIVVLGKDTDAAYYGLATLEQMLDQTEDGQLKISTFEDYAFQKYRGCVEGYYGYPWSVEGTLSWFDFAKKYKMNVFLYGPKNDPYHLGQWDEDYPTEVTEEESKLGVRTQDEMRQIAEKAAQCNVDFVWVAHPAMKKPIDFTNEETVDEGVGRLMVKFDHMYDLGVRQFGIFVDDIDMSTAASTCDMQIYMLNQVQEKLYAAYNTEGAAAEDCVKPLFFTPAWYTTGSGGASTYMPKLRALHEDIEICFTGNNVFSDISNSSATTFKNWIGRDPVMWWNYPVNDNVDNVYYTNPIDHFYSLDSNPSNLKGVISNPMNYSESSKVAFFGLADYTWNPQAFDADENWEHCFDAILPDDPEMAQALKVVYGSLNYDYEPSELTRLYAQYGSGNEEAAPALMEKMYEILDSIEKLETLKDSEDPVKRLIVEEAQASINKLYDMAAAIGGAMAVVSSDDPIVQTHGYYIANEAYERFSIDRNPRYQIVALEGSGEDYYYSIWYANPSDNRMKGFVTTAMEAIEDFDIGALDTSAAEINSVEISPSESVVVRQGESFQFTANVDAAQEDTGDVIWTVEGGSGAGTSINWNGILTLDTNELSPTVTVKAVSAYDDTVYDTVEVTVADRIYVDPTIPVNQAFGAKVLGGSGSPGVGGGPENLFDESEDGSKWCPGDNTRYNHWAAFDLGAEKTIYTWETVHAGVEHELDISSDFSLQVLADPDATEEQLSDQSYLANASNWTTVAEYRDNTENITDYEFEEPVTARYFRLYISDGCQDNVPYPATRIYELRLFGVDTATVARTHSLTIDPSITGGTITTDAAHYEEGAKVNIYVEPDEGCKLAEGSLKYNDTVVEGTSFLMPAEDVMITAEFTEGSEEPDPGWEDEDALAALVNPVVQKYELAENSGTWTMTADTRFAVTADQENIENERLAEVVGLIYSEITEKEIVSSSPLAMVYANEEDAQPSDILITLDKDGAVCEESDSEEAYTIVIGKDGVKINGASENAVLYALRTVQNYMVANKGLPYGTITDYPDVAERRLHVDCGRKYFTKDWFIRQIREMSYMKMNTLEMHFSENLGFGIECKTDPAIVSDQYLTHEEVREILAEAKKYGIKVIPSFDSPGHVDQILKAHPEYGQVNINGDHYASGLDVTNPEAVAYIRTLYDEYMELFEGCTDFHIGGDEYMEFDRAPFTTQYKPVLNEYAAETLGEGATWKDVMANYINELAEYVYSKGFKPRVFNDGLYYGETDWEGPQQIVMHDYIGIDYWSKMTWNPAIAGMQTFIDKGHEDIYNFNSTFFYYVLRNDMPTDGREQHSFDYIDQDRRIFEEWTPGKFASYTAPDDASYIAGAAMGIWCDNPDLVTEDVVTDDIADEMRSLATKSWNVSSSDNMDFEQFKANYEVLGHVAGYEKGSQLPDAGEFQNAESLGKVTLCYVSDTGKTLRDNVVKYGNVGDTYSFEAEDIYGYRLISEGTVSGVYSSEGETYTFTYTLDTDKSELEQELEDALDAAYYIPETFEAYSQAYAAAEEAVERADIEQAEIDEILAQLREAKGQAVLLVNYPLYVETKYPLSDIGYAAGYEEYEAAVEEGREILYAQGDDPAAVKAAFDKICEAAEGLQKPGAGTPEISADDGYYTTYSYDKMLDGNESTKCWFNKDQTAGRQFMFTFPVTVSLSGIRILQPADVGADYIEGAEVQISADGESWQTVGTIGPDDRDTELSFEAVPAKYVRVVLTETKKNWYQIAEVSFTYEEIAEDTTLRDLIREAEGLDISEKDTELVNAMISALIEAQKLYAQGSTDTDAVQAAAAALEAAIEALKENPAPGGEISTAILEYAIELAEGIDIDSSGVIDAVKENFETALQNAKDILARVQAGDTDVTESDVDSAWRNLIQAMQYLEFKQADKTDLEKVIALAEEMNKNLDAYLDAGKEAFTSALAAAKELYADGNVMDQEEVNSAWQNLLDAMANLMLKPDKGLLEDLIAQAEGLSEADYEAQSFAAMRAALAAAKDVFANEDATQEEIDASAAALKDAVAKLTLADSGDGQQGGNTDSGQSGNGSQDQGQTGGSSDKSNASSTAGKTSSAQKSSGTQQSAPTGDEGNYIFWGAAAVLAAAAAAAAAYRRKRQK